MFNPLAFASSSVLVEENAAGGRCTCSCPYPGPVSVTVRIEQVELLISSN